LQEAARLTLSGSFRGIDKIPLRTLPKMALRLIECHRGNGYVLQLCERKVSFSAKIDRGARLLTSQLYRPQSSRELGERFPFPHRAHRAWKSG
jgi:hypothetical protein